MEELCDAPEWLQEMMKDKQWEKKFQTHFWNSRYQENKKNPKKKREEKEEKKTNK